MFNIKDIQYKNYNERDIEVPALLDAIKTNLPKINTLIDVGAQYSWFTYAPAVRELLGKRQYMGIDTAKCEKTAKIVDKYINLDCREVDYLGDFVACVSMLEHVGVKPATEDYRNDRFEVFSWLCETAKRYLFITVPFGQAAIFEGEYANVTEADLDSFDEIAKIAGFKKINKRFFYTKFAQGQQPWEEISLERASDVPMDKSLGVQCIMIYEASKE